MQVQQAAQDREEMTRQSASEREFLAGVFRELEARADGVEVAWASRRATKLGLGGPHVARSSLALTVTNAHHDPHPPARGRRPTGATLCCEE